MWSKHRKKYICTSFNNNKNLLVSPTWFYFQKLAQTVRVVSDFPKLPGEEISTHHLSGDLRVEPPGHNPQGRTLRAIFTGALVSSSKGKLWGSCGSLALTPQSNPGSNCSYWARQLKSEVCMMRWFHTNLRLYYLEIR